MEFEEFFKYIGIAITVIGSIAGAVWAFRKWWVRDEHFPRVNFELKVDVVDQKDGKVILDIISVLENKGVVPLKIHDFCCEVRGIKTSDTLSIGSTNIRNQLNFSNQLANGWFMPTEWKYSFVYPTIKTDYSFITIIPDDTEYVLVKASFTYFKRCYFFGESRGHHASKLLKIPNKSSKLDAVTGAPS